MFENLTPGDIVEVPLLRPHVVQAKKHCSANCAIAVCLADNWGLTRDHSIRIHSVNNGDVGITARGSGKRHYFAVDRPTRDNIALFVREGVMNPDVELTVMYIGSRPWVLEQRTRERQD